jgi:hypothetical protein
MDKFWRWVTNKAGESAVRTGTVKIETIPKFV